MLHARVIYKGMTFYNFVVYHLHLQKNIRIFIWIEGVQLLGVIVDIVEDWGVVFSYTGVPATHFITIFIRCVTSISVCVCVWSYKLWLNALTTGALALEQR